MNATDTTVTELATVPAGITAPASPPGTGVHAGPMTIRHRGFAQSVHPDAYVAPSAVLSGQVSVGAGSCIMHGAVLAAQDGPVQVGAGCHQAVCPSNRSSRSQAVRVEPARHAGDRGELLEVCTAGSRPG